MNVSCGSDAHVATSANIFSRDVGVAPTKQVDDFHGNKPISELPQTNQLRRFPPLFLIKT